MTNFTTGPAGENLIKRNEGVVLHTYLDIRGIPTIAFGITGPEAWPGRVITMDQALQMLADRLKSEFEPGVNRALGNAPTTQNQFDAMISLAFNIGVGGFLQSSVLRDHLGNREIAEKGDFEKWDMAGGRELDALLRRRDEEYAVYSNPNAELPPPVVTSTPAPMPADPVIVAWHKASTDAQTFLKENGFYDGKIDGWFGDQSYAALIAYSKTRS